MFQTSTLSFSYTHGKYRITLSPLKTPQPTLLQKLKKKITIIIPTPKRKQTPLGSTYLS